MERDTVIVRQLGLILCLVLALTLETFEVFEVPGPAPEAPGDPCASS